MSVENDIGAAEALAVLAEAQALETSFNLWHRSGASVTLYGVIVTRGLGAIRPQFGRQTNTGALVLDIPNQDNFDANIDDAGTRPIQKGDKIEFPASSGRYFFIDDDIELRSNGYVYRVTAIERKTNVLGNTA